MKILSIFIILLTFSLKLDAKNFSFDVPNKKVSINNNEKEPSLVVFVNNSNKGLIILKLIGPKQKVILQEKTKFLSMWTWKKTGEFSYPSVFHFYTNKKKNEIDFQIKKELVDNIKLFGKDDDNLKRDLIKKQIKIGLFSIKNNAFKSIEKENKTFFKVPINLPINSPPGKYTLVMESYENNKKISKKPINLVIKKPGFNSFIFEFAYKFSFLYGLISAIIAILLGIGAGYFFRK